MGVLVCPHVYSTEMITFTKPIRVDISIFSGEHHTTYCLNGVLENQQQKATPSYTKSRWPEKNLDCMGMPRVCSIGTGAVDQTLTGKTAEQLKSVTVVVVELLARVENGVWKQTRG